MMWHMLLTIGPLFFVTPVFTKSERHSKTESERSKQEQKNIVLDGCLDTSYHPEENVNENEVCELLGPTLDVDGEVIQIPSTFKSPKHLEHSIEFDLPVGFNRLRRAMLNGKTAFWTEAVMKDTLRYKKITQTEWDSRQEHNIGLRNSEKHHDEIVGAKRTTNYLMPRTALVGESMAYEEATITVYNDFCFALKKVTLTPDVPFGKKFEAHTQIVVLNTGKHTCRMICSVEAKFPNGPPIGIAWKIKSAMKSGTIEVFKDIRRAILECSAGVQMISTYC